MDTLLLHCSLQHLKRFYPFPLGPVHEKTPMKSPPEIRSLNAPVANWRVYSFKNTINSNIGDKLWHPMCGPCEKDLKQWCLETVHRSEPSPHLDQPRKLYSENWSNWNSSKGLSIDSMNFEESVQISGPCLKKEATSKSLTHYL